MGKHAFAAFSKADFASSARIFWDIGYRTAASIRDRDSGEGDLFLSRAKMNFRGGNLLSDMRLFLEISGWFEPRGRIRGGLSTNFGGIDIDGRMGQWATDLSGIPGILMPDQEMANFSSVDLEKGRVARTPFAPYEVADSIASNPWLPADEPHARSREKWRATQKGFNRYTGSQDLAIGQYALYRVRFILDGDLTDARGEFGGLVAQFSHLALVLDLSITDHAGIAVTYDRLIHQLIHKTDPKRSSTTDYFALLITINADVKSDVIRDFEARAETIKKEKEKVRNEADKEKAKKTKDWDNKNGERRRKKGGRKPDDPPTRWEENGPNRIGRHGLNAERVGNHPPR